MIRQTLLYFFIVCLTATGFAQSGTTNITGVIMDEKDEPLIGATVRIDGVPGGQATDLEGKFSISIPKGKTSKLIISCFGYKTITESVNANTKPLHIRMETEGMDMDEVVVIGYGTAKKSELTASVETVSAKDLAKIPAMNLDQSLAGQVAGLGVQAYS